MCLARFTTASEAHRNLSRAMVISPSKRLGLLSVMPHTPQAALRQSRAKEPSCVPTVLWQASEHRLDDNHVIAVAVFAQCACPIARFHRDAALHVFGQTGVLQLKRREECFQGFA